MQQPVLSDLFTGQEGGLRPWLLSLSLGFIVSNYGGQYRAGILGHTIGSLDSLSTFKRLRLKVLVKHCGNLLAVGCPSSRLNLQVRTPSPTNEGFFNCPGQGGTWNLLVPVHFLSAKQRLTPLRYCALLRRRLPYLKKLPFLGQRVDIFFLQKLFQKNPSGKKSVSSWIHWRGQRTIPS